MQPIPVQVHNVTVYAYFNPTEPLTEVILAGASGTYAVGTLLTNIFYNLNLDNEGKQQNPLNLHGKYYATGQYESGEYFTTPWMYCLDNSSTPEFGRTITLGAQTGAVQNEDTQLGVTMDVESGLIPLTKLHNITVSQQFPPPAIGSRLLIENGQGYLVATRTGTPHTMGVLVKNGDVVGPVHVGESNILVSGVTDEGARISRSQCTCVRPPFPAVFLQELV